MVVLIDANIALTYLTGREDPYTNSVCKIFDMNEDGKLDLCLAFHSLSILWYVLRKLLRISRIFSIRKSEP